MKVGPDNLNEVKLWIIVTIVGFEIDDWIHIHDKIYKAQRVCKVRLWWTESLLEWNQNIMHDEIRKPKKMPLQ